MALYFCHSPCLFCMVLICYFCTTDVFKFAVNMEQFLLKCTEFMLTISMSPPVLSCVISCFISFTALVFWLLHTLLKWLTLLQSLHVLPYARHCLGGFVLPQYLHAGCDGVLCCAVLLWLPVHICLDTFILSNSLHLVITLITVAWAHCASTLFTLTMTLPLVVCLSLFTVVNSLIISSNMFCH